MPRRGRLRRTDGRRTTSIRAESDKKRYQHSIKYDEGRRGFTVLRDCQSIEGVIHWAFKRKSLSSRDIAAVWSHLSCLVAKRGQAQCLGRMERRVNKLNDLIRRTVAGIVNCSPLELCQTAQGMANIINAVESDSGGALSCHQKMFHDALIGRDMDRKQHVFNAIVSAAVPILPRFDSRGYTNLAYAFAVADVPEEERTSLFDHIDDAIVSLDDLRSFRPVDLSNLLWAYAKSSTSHRCLFDLVATEVSKYRQLRTFEPKHLSNIVWAYATARVSDCCLFGKIVDEISRRKMDHFNRQDLANTVWAYATSGNSHPRLFETVADEIASRDLGTFRAQELCNILWAYATAKVPHRTLYRRVANEVSRRCPRTFTPDNLSYLVWACATTKLENPRLFNSLADEVNKRDLVQFEPPNISNIVWAFAAAKVEHPRLFRKVAEELIRRNLGSFSTKQLSNILWAYATAKAPSSFLFNVIADEVDKQRDFDPQHVANMLWAFAASGQVDPSFFVPMVPKAAALIHRCNCQDLTNIAWSYAVADIDADTLFNGRFVDAVVKKIDRFPVESLSQLHQWHLWVAEEKVDAGLPLTLQEKCRRAFVSRKPTISALQRDVVSELRRIGLEPEEEYLTKSGYSLDALVVVDGKQVGVEVDGPWHFIGRKPTGSTMLKRRQIANVERMRLVSVPYWEWHELGWGRRKRQGYLRALLEDHDYVCRASGHWERDAYNW